MSSLPPPVSYADEVQASFSRLTAGLDLLDPSVRARVHLAFRDHAAVIDVEALLPELPPTITPSAARGFPPLPTVLPALPAGNLPLPPSRSLLPGINLGGLSSLLGGHSSAAHRSLPSAPMQLRGNTLPESKVVATALRNNWAVHIPLSAFSTKSLLQLGSSSRSQSDSDQSLSVKEGILTVSAPYFDGKSERTLTVEEWSHAWPRLVSMIRRYLPGDHAAAIADSWESHFSSLFARYDFFVNFPLYLKYDIHVRQSFMHNHTFTPSEWQEEVWRAIVQEHNTPALQPSFSSFPAMARNSATSSSFQNTSLLASTPKVSAPTPFRASQAQPSSHKCIFCGKTECRSCACGTTCTSFVSLDSSNVWTTSAGEQVCFRFNGRGCSRAESDCGRRHLCIRCGGSHSSQTCSQ
ncbi:uncharacterized protein HD556DRAFT_663696 [Suillus plorans]|uniref:Uncharacterized protein n=1 Tax=Suillus plorans TaxID=116603 RepID=A0A9P7AK38_9AGAM|nr:uncharacterized protein HD556DRAFT_663696 [Suillus plorans]KAG1791074.1 hypothetical protein HD556DRAFT_663696 [Suillus plorans]